MRQDTGTRPARTPFPGPRRIVAAGAPIAIVGTLALTAGAAPAMAAPAREADQTRTPHIRTAGPKALSGDPRTASALRVAAQAASGQYTVQPGDTVSAIAARHGLRTADVLTLNGLGWSTIIQPGQVLRLEGVAAPAPAPSAPAPTVGAYTVVAGDTISAIARRAGVSTEAVLTANGLTWSSVILPGQQILVPGGAAPVSAAAEAPAPAPPAAGGYTVVAGDTVSAIASRHGSTVDAVLAANGLTRESIIYPGQTIALPSAPAPAMTPVAAAVPADLDAEQTANARLIIAVGRELGVPDRGIAIALGTAMQESWLRNLDWGDRDSLGLFQQRPSTGWGTAEEVRDPYRATRAFFGGAGDPNGTITRGLLDIPGWESLSFADAAQAVQISAYPDRYAQWEQPATTWLALLG